MNGNYAGNHWGTEGLIGRNSGVLAIVGGNSFPKLPPVLRVFRNWQSPANVGCKGNSIYKFPSLYHHTLLGVCVYDPRELGTITLALAKAARISHYKMSVLPKGRTKL